MSRWLDTSSHSKRSTDRAPKEWTLSFSNTFRITIHHHTHYPPELWFVSCHELGIECEELKSKTTEMAQREAVARVEALLDKYLSAVQKHINDRQKADAI